MARGDYGVDMDGTTRAILGVIEDAGYLVSVHAFDGRVEMHAVPATDPDAELRVARTDEGDGIEQVYKVACMLATATGVEIEDG